MTIAYKNPQKRDFSRHFIGTDKNALSVRYLAGVFILVWLAALLLPETAFPDSCLVECEQITSWSEADGDFDGFYMPEEGSVNYCNKPPCSNYYTPASMQTEQSLTGFHAEYGINAWEDIGIYLNIASFESHEIALSAFEEWANEWCPAGYSNPVRTDDYCLKTVDHWDLVNRIIDGCSHVSLVKVCRGNIITLGPYIFGDPQSSFIPELCEAATQRFDELADHVRILVDNKCEKARLSIWAEPHVAPHAQETAVIPGDDRFPAKFQLTLRDSEGQLFADQTLTVSIMDASIARLEGGGQSGRELNLTTNSQGQVLLTYTYLGAPPSGDGPLVDTITIKSDELGLHEAATVSVGLNIQVGELTKAFRGNEGNFPKTLGLRIGLQDRYRPEMNLFSYLTALEKVTGHTVGMKVAVEWLNVPSPRIMDTFRRFVPDLANPPSPTLYDGGGVISLADIGLSEVIVEALGQPQIVMGPNTLPAITFTAPGIYWFRLLAGPILLHDGSSDFNDFIGGAGQWEVGPIFSASVLEESESVFQSLVCSFNPTNKQQFIAKTLFLDNPFFTTVEWVGVWLGKKALPTVLLVTEVSSLVCDLMQGNLLNSAATLSAKYLKHLDGLRELGEIVLTDNEMRLLKAGLLAESIKKLIDTFNDSVKHFFPKGANARTLSMSEYEPSLYRWPESLSFADFREAVIEMNTGLMLTPDTVGWECIAVLGNGQVALKDPPGGLVSSLDDGANVYLLPSGSGSLVVLTNEDVNIFRVKNKSRKCALFLFYPVNSAGELTRLTLDLTNGDTLLIDRGADGSVDDFLSPGSKTFWLPVFLINTLNLLLW